MEGAPRPDKVDVQEEARITLGAMVLELRQSFDFTGNGEAIVELESIVGGDLTDSVTFHSDRIEAAQGPEKYKYELRNCVANRCELWKTVWFAESPYTEPYSYPATATHDNAVMHKVVADGTPIFTGIEWISGTRTETDSCDGTTGNLCDFPLVEVIFRLDPNPERGNDIVQVQEQVRMRNA